LGLIAAVGNGDPASTEPFQSNQRNAFNGLCMLMIKSTEKAGKITIQANVDGLETAFVTVITD